MKKIHILMVEDEEVLAMVVKETLENRGFEITIATNGIEAWSKFNLYKPDICVIDIMVPKKDGLSLVSDIRKVDDQVPIIFLTAKIQTNDVLKGLEAGADDYMKKPFSMEELILRIKRLVRRSSGGADQHNSTALKPLITTIGNYTLNYSRLELIYHDTIINISNRDAELLKLLLAHKNELLDKRTALLQIWGEDTIYNSRTMDVYITRLRKYLMNDPQIEIVNIRGKGYKLME